MSKILYGGDSLSAGIIVPVDALPTANATNYAKNQLYLYNDEIYFIVLDSGSYKYKKIGQPAPSGYSVTCSFTETDVSMKSYVKIYDGQDNTGTLLFESTTATATPTTTITCSSGYLFIYVDGSDPYTSYTSVTGGVTIYDESTYLGSRTFVVSGDGTISMTISYDG